MILHLALLSLAVKEHIVQQHLGRHSRHLALRRDAAGKLDRVDVGISVAAQRCGGLGSAHGAALGNGAQVARAAVRVDVAHVKFEGATHLGPACEKAGPSNLAPRRLLLLALRVGGGEIAKQKIRDAPPAAAGLRDGAHDAIHRHLVAGHALEDHAALPLGVLGVGWHSSREDLHAILAAGAADEAAQDLAGECAAALARVALDGEKHRLLLVEVAQVGGLGPGIGAHSGPVVAHVLRQETVVRDLVVAGHGNVLAGLELERVVGAAAAAVPVVRDLRGFCFGERNKMSDKNIRIMDEFNGLNGKYYGMYTQDERKRK